MLYEQTFYINSEWLADQAKTALSNYPNNLEASRFTLMLTVMAHMPHDERFQKALATAADDEKTALAKLTADLIDLFNEFIPRTPIENEPNLERYFQEYYRIDGHPDDNDLVSSRYNFEEVIDEAINQARRSNPTSLADVIDKVTDLFIAVIRTGRHPDKNDIAQALQISG